MSDERDGQRPDDEMPAARSLRRRRTDATQARARASIGFILEAARLLILERGYDGWSMRDLVDKSGVAVGTVYRYYANREAILADLLQRRRELQRDRLTAALAAHREAPLRDLVRAGVEALTVLPIEEPKLQLAMNEAQFALVQPAGVFATVGEYGELAERVLEQRAAELRVDDVPAAVKVAGMLIAGALFSLPWFAASGADVVAVREQLVDALTRLLCRDDEGPPGGA